jgi:HEAT repeat protein
LASSPRDDRFAAASAVSAITSGKDDEATAILLGEVLDAHSGEIIIKAVPALEAVLKPIATGRFDGNEIMVLAQCWRAIRKERAFAIDRRLRAARALARTGRPSAVRVLMRLAHDEQEAPDFRAGLAIELDAVHSIRTPASRR